MVLADEPTGNIDPDSADRVLSALHAATVSGTAVLLATHSAALADAASRRYELAGGKVRELAMAV